MKRPPAHEVRAVWKAAKPVHRDSEVAAFLERRAIDPAVVADRDLARALRADTPVPRWAWGPGGSWTETGHRLLLPMFGPTGQLETVRARCVLAGGDPSRKKALSPAGASVAGTVLADPLARILLSTGTIPEWWSAPSLIIPEGDPDFLTWATAYGDAPEEAPAVMGVIAGSWTAEIAMRIPSRIRVAIRTHADPAGEKYAEKIANTLRGRCGLHRATR